MDLFLIEQMHPVFVTDAKLSTHPIVQTVSNPDEITAIFDEISYKKVYWGKYFFFFYILWIKFIWWNINIVQFICSLLIYLLARDRQLFEWWRTS